MDEKSLNNNITDYIVSSLSGVAGLIPLAGNALSEIIHTTVPKQRQDRIVNFILNLSEKISELSIEVEELKRKFDNPIYGSFLYKTLRIVTNEVYDEKILFYKNICIDAITAEEKELIHNERILNILESMDYYEILYLQFYSNVAFMNNNELREIQDTLGFISLKPVYMMGISAEKMDEETYKQVTINNLLNKGLLEKEYKTVGNKINEKLKITMLGKLVLRKIGISDTNN